MQTEQDNVRQMIEWLRRRATEQQMPIEFPAGDKGRVVDGVLVSIPVVVRGNGDAGDKADMMQRLEDAWNEQKLDTQPEVILVPAVA